MNAKDTTASFLPEAGGAVCCVFELQAQLSLADEYLSSICSVAGEAGKHDGEMFADILEDYRRAFHHGHTMTYLRRVNFRYEDGVPQREEAARLTPL